MTIRGKTLERGAVVRWGTVRYAFIRWGCATNLSACTRKVPVTVARLRRDGTEAPASMTECFEADELMLDVDPEQLEAMMEAGDASASP